MRISDWSSDVCSSDLQRLGIATVEIDLGATIAGQRHLVVDRRDEAADIETRRRIEVERRLASAGLIRLGEAAEAIFRHERDVARDADRWQRRGNMRGRGDRQRVVEGKRVLVRGALGGRSISKTK